MKKKLIIIFILVLLVACNRELLKVRNFVNENFKDFEILEIPDSGSKGILKGRINKRKFPLHCIAVYIYKNGWFNKPYWHPAVTSIKPDGTFECDITTESGDEFANKIAIFVISENFKPPLLSGEKELPNKLFRSSYYNIILQREVIEFSGYKWIISSSRVPIGPGPNYFTNNPSDIYVDNEGRLHLKISYRDGKWHSSAVILSQYLGYGTYIFYLSSRFDLFDKNTVVGLFTWDNNAPEDNYREIDIEFSRWGIDNYENTQFVVQPSGKPGNIFRFNIKLDGEKINTMHLFRWTEKSILFQSYYGHKKEKENLIKEWLYKGKDIPSTGGERVMINFWLVDGKSPSDQNEAEVVIDKFEFIPEKL